MDKSPDAFRTISEAAEDLDVPQHVLRFWESKFHQIKPLKRGGGRRYYRPVDVDLLRGIKQLLYGDGYTIKGVQKILRENGIAYVQAARGKQASAEGNHSKAKTGKEIIKNPVAEETLQTPQPDEIQQPRVVAPQAVPAAAPVAKPSMSIVQGPTAEQSRLLKAALFELSEIKLLLESAPRKP